MPNRKNRWILSHAGEGTRSARSAGVARDRHGVFARYANLTWGGGSATISVIHEQIVLKRRWISELQFDVAFALSRLTPGTNLLAFCTAAGWLTRRWVGGRGAGGPRRCLAHSWWSW